MAEEYLMRMKKYADMKKYCEENLYPKFGIKDLFSLDLETFRKELQKIPDRLKRDVCTYNIALRYGMVQENREPIKFYFEMVGGVDG